MVGKIRTCTKEGIQVSLEFFDDIIIPSYSLQVSSHQLVNMYAVSFLSLFMRCYIYSHINRFHPSITIRVGFGVMLRTNLLSWHLVML
jgi:hypothetical protein